MNLVEVMHDVVMISVTLFVLSITIFEVIVSLSTCLTRVLLLFLSGFKQ